LERQKSDGIEIVPIGTYPNVDPKAECPKLVEFNPLPVWGKCWRAYQSYRDANGLIRSGLRQAIDKARGGRR
jgi:hypothetical protein